MKTYINEYLESKRLAWAPSTLKSESARLAAIAEAMDGDPDRLWRELDRMRPYARVTTWTRATAFYTYLQDRGLVKGNPYKVFRETNARLFKNTYHPSKPELTYEEAKTRIETLADPAIQKRALEILGCGARWSESESHCGGVVCGKGNKDRTLYVPDIPGPAYFGTYQTFRRALATVGLKPHDLRKLFLSRMVELGSNEFELMEVAGWSSIGPARSYINVKNATKNRVMTLQGKH